MGFPVGYPEVSVPNIFLYTLSLLSFLRSLTISFLSLLHLSDLLDTDFSTTTLTDSHIHRPTLSAILIREFLPIITFNDLAGGDSPPAAAGCAVCLNEFAGEEEIRCMANCRHMFHRTCVDRWIDHDQKTCPLCTRSEHRSGSGGFGPKMVKAYETECSKIEPKFDRE